MKSGAHTLVTGMTEYGKTTFMKRLIKDAFKHSGKYKKIIVLDEKKDPGFLADIVTDDPVYFLQSVEPETDCLLIIDDAGDNVGRYAGAIRKVATMYRGLGHQAFFITQRAQIFDRTMREQCSNLICFRQSLEDAKDLSRTFPELRVHVEAVPRLEPGEYFFIPSFGAALRGRLWRQA